MHLACNAGGARRLPLPAGAACVPTLRLLISAPSLTELPQPHAAGTRATLKTLADLSNAKFNDAGVALSSKLQDAW